MTRRSQRRPVPRGRRYSDEYDDYSYHPRRRREGCLAPIKRFFHTVAIIFLTALGAIVFFLVVLLIAFNFQTFVQILYYALFVGAGLAILGVLYVIVRIITAISHRISAASAARSKAKLDRERARIERERVQQARVQVLAQEAKLNRDDYAFYQKYEDGYYESPRRTRVIREEEAGYDQPLVRRTTRNFQEESSHRTRVLAQQDQMQSLPEPEPEPEPELTELELLGMPAKGQVFRYRDYKKLLKPGQLIVGVDGNGSPRIGSWQEFKILLILGASSSGKTTTAAEKCLCIVDAGGQLVVCDPGGFKPDSLTRRITSLQGALMPGTTVALEHEDIMQNVEAFGQELERRRRGADMTTPVLLVIDELNGLLMDKEIKKDLTGLIEKFGQQARGYNLYMVLCAQRASGLATIRNSVISFICHKCAEMEASKILPARYAKLAPQLGVGQTFVGDADGYIDSLQQVLVKEEDMRGHLPSTTTTYNNRRTVPIAPRQSRQFGAPAVQEQQQQKLILRRTNLVQDQTVASPQTAPVPLSPQAQQSRVQPPTTHQPGRAGAVWGEEPPLLQPALPPITEDVTQFSLPMPTPIPSGQPPQQDTLELLALRRAKKKK